MIAKENRPFANQNRILHAKSRIHHWEGPGALSIKTFSNGKAYYKAKQGYYAVEEGRYLLLNEGDYAITIESETEVESFCLFFRSGMAEEAASRLNLDDPFTCTDASIDFIEKTYPNDPILIRKLIALRSKHLKLAGDPLWLEEQLNDIIRTLFIVHKKTLKEIEQLPAMNGSTREEIFRRISVARDFADACYDRPLKLSEIAQVACLSINHLLRNYRAIYGTTPYRHITEKRMMKARKLLTGTNHSITEIGFKCGFETPSSFTKRFRHSYGLSPSQFRRKVRMDK